MNNPKHIAIIMDGNRRWAESQDLKKHEGYKAGIVTAKEIIKACLEKNIKYLTVYAFSYENWNRPIKEISCIINIGIEFMKINQNFFMENDIKCTIIGNRDLIPFGLVNIINEIEEKTKNNKTLNLQIAISYSGRDEILRANQKSTTEKDFESCLDTNNIPDPEILIRTGGQNRLSNFLLWQLAYTEIYFIKTMWPDFSKTELYEILEDFQQIKRNFGSI